MSEQRSSLVRATVRARRTNRSRDLAVGSVLEETKATGVKRTPGPATVPRRAREDSDAIDSNPTLSQAWSRDDPGPQYAFKMSMFNVSCNSH